MEQAKIRKRIGTGPQRRTALADRVARPVKRTVGRSGTSQTPLNVRTMGLRLTESERGYLRERLGRRLGKFGAHIERVTARFEDVNGPKGGIDTACRIKVVLSGLPSVIIEEQAETVKLAFNRAAARTERAVGQALGRSGLRTPRRKVVKKPTRARRKVAKRRAPKSPKGSLIGRRVGRSRANLARAAERPEKTRRDVPVDTAAPKTSATHRKVGVGATATRNTRLRDSGMIYTLEDSAKPRPSRKSTRRSSNRIKTDANLRRRETHETRAPGSRAEKAAARKRRAKLV